MPANNKSLTMAVETYFDDLRKHPVLQAAVLA